MVRLVLAETLPRSTSMYLCTAHALVWPLMTRYLPRYYKNVHPVVSGGSENCWVLTC